MMTPTENKKREKRELTQFVQDLELLPALPDNATIEERMAKLSEAEYVAAVALLRLQGNDPVRMHGHSWNLASEEAVRVVQHALSRTFILNGRGCGVVFRSVGHRLIVARSISVSGEENIKRAIASFFREVATVVHKLTGK